MIADPGYPHLPGSRAGPERQEGDVDDQHTCYDARMGHERSERSGDRQAGEGSTRPLLYGDGTEEHHPGHDERVERVLLGTDRELGEGRDVSKERGSDQGRREPEGETKRKPADQRYRREPAD